MTWAEGVEGVKAAAELLKVVAWPCAVVLVVWWLRAAIRQFLESIAGRKMQVQLPGGIAATIEAAEQQQVVAENPISERISEEPTVFAPSPRPALNLMESALRTQLNQVDRNNREAVLLRALSTARLDGGHEFTYNRIFGSQITALKRLNEVGQATVDDARAFFAPYASQFPQLYSTYGFDSWLGFLTNSGLVTQTGNTIAITDIGRDFLLYITDKRLLENKPW
jgi:hypothetical protein